MRCTGRMGQSVHLVVWLTEVNSQKHLSGTLLLHENDCVTPFRKSCHWFDDAIVNNTTQLRFDLIAEYNWVRHRVAA